MKVEQPLHQFKIYSTKMLLKSTLAVMDALLRLTILNQILFNLLLHHRDLLFNLHYNHPKGFKLYKLKKIMIRQNCNNRIFNLKTKTIIKYRILKKFNIKLMITIKVFLKIYYY